MKKRRNYSKKLFSAIFAAALILGLSGCGSNGEKTETNTSADTAQTAEVTGTSENLKEFRIGVGGNSNSYSMDLGKVAYDAGYLEEELNSAGYTVAIVPFAGAGPEINEALAAGELEAAVYGDFPAFISKSNGIDTTIVALVNGQQQYAVISANEEVQTAKDLEGRKVIVPQGTVAQYFWEHYAEARGIDSSRVDIINATTDAQSLLATGDADAYVMQPSSLYYLESLGVGTVIDTGADIPEGSTTYLFEVSSDILTENPQVGVAINKALIRAYNDAAANPQVLYDATASESLPAEFTRKNYEFDTTLSFMSPEITKDKIKYYKGLNDWLLDHSVISNPVDVDSFADTSYYEEAVKELEK